MCSHAPSELIVTKFCLLGRVGNVITNAKFFVLAVAILFVRPSDRLFVTRVDQSKTVQARITKPSLSAAWKTLVSGIVKLFHKFEGGHPERKR